MFPAPSLIQHAHIARVRLSCIGTKNNYVPQSTRTFLRPLVLTCRQLKPSNSSLVELKPSVPLTTSLAFELTHLCISGGRIPPQVAGAREMCLTVGAVVRISKLLPVPLTAASP